MTSSFNSFKKLHDNASLEIFNTDKNAQLWLKVKSISRKELISEFCLNNKIKLQATSLSNQFEELFAKLEVNIDNSNKILDEYIVLKNKYLLNELDREQLISDLYKMKTFEWGGDQTNSLDKYLITHYVKSIRSYDELIRKFDKEINQTVKGYVMNSWYNHWTSILIEHIFKSHHKVLPTVGQIKNVDFFINNIPFDLKVTYFPAEYLKGKRKEKKLPVELTYLKSKAKELNIVFDKNKTPSDIYYEIIEKLKNKNSVESLKVIDTLKQENIDIVNETQNNSKELARWLYENQGEMRFGSENRLFVVLIDTETTNFSNSWELKRNFDLLVPSINKFLDNFSTTNITDLEIEFNYKSKPNLFHSLAQIIFIKK
jgi:hypothetical protein